MMFKTHLAFGLLIAILSLNFLNPPNVYIFIAIVLLGSLLPDLDSRRSFVGHNIKPVSYSTEFIFGHRGFLHTIFPIIVLYLIFNYFMKLNVLGTALIIGYLSHLLIDALTILGIMPFRPVHHKKLSGFIRTGSLSEYALFLLFILINIYILKQFF